MVRCLIALGSNQGDRAQNLLQAMELLRAEQTILLRRVSSFHLTSPVGGPSGQDAYFNAAAVIETELLPADLLRALMAIEQKLGRVRNERWGPRTIDLDVLLYGDTAIETAEITVPHPRMHERRFVLAPAAEIAADFFHPLLRQTVNEMLSELPTAANSEPRLKVFTSPAAIQAAVLDLRRQGKRIGFVPTMGALHAGHISLVERARELADVVIASIFVNPTQFGPQEDFQKYPRTLDGDLRGLSAAGCELVFVPTAAEIYPPGFSTYVEPPAVAQPLEGICRPGHFRGVATVVLKLFQIVPAHIACFGQKDYQQLQVIKRMVQDLAIPMEIVGCPTVREADGLAMSSRNRYLSAADRQRALSLSRALDQAEQMVRGGERNANRIAAAMKETLRTAGIEKLDYAAVADPNTLAELSTIDRSAVALIAAHVGNTRLIDNRILGSLT
ncbi:MAG TPA: pantoate--beta-alanine ligase [Pirellulaceae bacterium]|jgi:pantoate--beta-alanine ligase